MPLQKRRMGPARIHNRRSAWMRRAGKKLDAGKCPSCGEPRLPHRVCMSCGKYDGKTIVETAQADDE